MLQQCLLCNNKRLPGKKYCKSCLIYESYEDTIWYKELIDDQSKQRKIDSVERYPLLINTPAQMDGSPVQKYAYVRHDNPRGRPKRYLDEYYKIAEDLLINNPSLSERKLEALLKQSGLNVSRYIIRQIKKRRKVASEN